MIGRVASIVTFVLAGVLARFTVAWICQGDRESERAAPTRLEDLPVQEAVGRVRALSRDTNEEERSAPSAAKEGALVSHGGTNVESSTRRGPADPGSSEPTRSPKPTDDAAELLKAEFETYAAFDAEDEFRRFRDEIRVLPLGASTADVCAAMQSAEVEFPTESTESVAMRMSALASVSGDPLRRREFEFIATRSRDRVFRVTCGDAEGGRRLLGPDFVGTLAVRFGKNVPEVRAAMMERGADVSTVMNDAEFARLVDIVFRADVRRQVLRAELFQVLNDTRGEGSRSDELAVERVSAFVALGGTSYIIERGVDVDLELALDAEDAALEAIRARALEASR